MELSAANMGPPRQDKNARAQDLSFAGKDRVLVYTGPPRFRDSLVIVCGLCNLTFSGAQGGTILLPCSVTSLARALARARKPKTVGRVQTPNAVGCSRTVCGLLVGDLQLLLVRVHIRRLGMAQIRRRSRVANRNGVFLWDGGTNLRRCG